MLKFLHDAAANDDARAMTVPRHFLQTAELKSYDHMCNNTLVHMCNVRVNNSFSD